MNYKKNLFHVEHISTEKLSKKFKTPLYCYSYLRLKNNITNFKNHFKKLFLDVISKNNLSSHQFIK